MKTLNPELKARIEVWLAPLPEKFQGLVWKALRDTAKAGVPFNTHANDFSELFLWHLSPAGNMFWDSVNQTTEYFWKLQWDQFGDLGRMKVRMPHKPARASAAA